MATKVLHDKRSDAIYIQFSELPYSYGNRLDDERYIDYGENGELLGISILDLRAGVDLEGLPERDTIEKVLTERGIKVTRPV
jgi:uncharacterized protein YuzE